MVRHERDVRVSAPVHDVDLILSKQVASYLAVPIFLVDPNGTLLYYNEPAEGMLGKRYEETGEMPMEEWSTIFHPTARDGSELDPGHAAALDRAPPAAWLRRDRHHRTRRCASRSVDHLVPARRSARATPRRRRDLLRGAVIAPFWATPGSVPIERQDGTVDGAGLGAL